MPHFLKHMPGLALAMALSSGAHAGMDLDCERGGFHTVNADSWFGRQTLENYSVSAPFGALGAWFTRDTAHPVVYGTLIGTAPGFAKQILDGTCRGDGFSYKDVVAAALGALTGAWLTNWAVTYSRSAHGTTVGLGYHDVF